MEKSASERKAFLDTVFADAGGAIPFERFMELALYDPEFGYYSSNVPDVGGSRADFSTWATLGELGKVIARWIVSEEAAVKGAGKTIPVIELGGGDGSLAKDIFRSFGWRRRRRLEYHMVEISIPLREIQAKRLPGKPVHWHSTIQSALAACGGRALIVSNEFVDAFPARWLRWNGETWEEIWLRFSRESGLAEEFRKTDRQPPLEFVTPSPEGQRIEQHDSYHRWLDAALADLVSGSLLTIDYGGSFESIYRRRPGGTMRGYFRHERLERGDVYRRFGQQDLTCDVNFDDLVRWGERAGLETVLLENQTSFMNRHGVAPGRSGAGDAFQVLVQRKPGP